MDWQTIDTAPKDNTWIECSYDGVNGYALPVRWHTDDKKSHFDGVWHGGWENSICMEMEQPTHWRHLTLDWIRKRPSRDLFRTVETQVLERELESSKLHLKEVTEILHEFLSHGTFLFYDNATKQCPESPFDFKKWFKKANSIVSRIKGTL